MRISTIFNKVYRAAFDVSSNIIPHVYMQGTCKFSKNSCPKNFLHRECVRVSKLKITSSFWATFIVINFVVINSIFLQFADFFLFRSINWIKQKLSHSILMNNYLLFTASILYFKTIYTFLYPCNPCDRPIYVHLLFYFWFLASFVLKIFLNANSNT